MKIVLAFDSFKGSLTAAEAVEAAREGVLQRWPGAEVVALPLGDGGEGTTEALCRTMDVEWRECEAHDPLMRPIQVHYAIRQEADGSKTAIMEMAATAGLTLLHPDERNPMPTTTYGVGEMLLDAVRNGCRHIIIGIGGSATNDGGMGMLAALGVRFWGEASAQTPLPPIGASLLDIHHIDWTHLTDLSGIAIDVICDVDNPLYGSNGAAHVYAPQKGATPAETATLDQGLRNLASLCARRFHRQSSTTPGSGAAGGLGYALLLLGANLRRGTDVILDAVGLDRHLSSATLVLTGEGRIDRQTLCGKLPYGVLQRALRQSVPVIALAGHVADEPQLLRSGFRAVHSITPPAMPQAEAMLPAVAKVNLRKAVETILSNQLAETDHQYY